MPALSAAYTHEDELRRYPRYGQSDRYVGVQIYLNSARKQFFTVRPQQALSHAELTARKRT